MEFRLDYQACRSLLLQRTTESAPGKIQLLAGPRQVGKTTLLLELARKWTDTAIYTAADGPEASLPGFWERIWARAAESARDAGRAIVLLDEIHAMPDWAARLKAEWDRIQRDRAPIHVVATGSSALRLGTGSRESLAGRFERLTLAHWPAAAIAAAFDIPPAAAAHAHVRIGSYPGAVPFRDDLGRYLAYVRDAIVEPAIGRDVLSLGAVRRPALLRQVFALAAASPAQIVSLQKLQGQLQDPGALETIAHYLALLEDAFLIAALDKAAVRPARRRSALPKLVTLNNALLAAVAPAGPPDSGTEPARFGAWVENACLAHAWNAGQRVTYWREEPLEVDGILDGSWGAWAVEVKTGHVSASDLRGLAEFTRRFPKYRPLVLTDRDSAGGARRLGFTAIPWEEFLLNGPPALR